MFMFFTQMCVSSIPNMYRISVALFCSLGALGFSTGVYPTWPNVKIVRIVGGLSCHAV